jgi:hypothetical protein
MVLRDSGRQPAGEFPAGAFSGAVFALCNLRQNIMGISAIYF